MRNFVCIKVTVKKIPQGMCLTQERTKKETKNKIKHNNIYILHNNSNILYYRDDDTSLFSEIKSPSSFMSEIKLRSIHMNYLAQIAISFSLFQYTTKRVLIRKD